MSALYIQLFSLHGLVRGSDLEMGRDADTGGQVKYVVELLRALADIPEVRKVDLFTRLILDKSYSSDYASPVEVISDKARIVRIQCGGRKYLRKERLWPFLDEYVDRMLRFLKQEGDLPDLVHGHYADGGYVASELSSLLGIPLVFTGHSLGIPKKQQLAGSGMSSDAMNRKFRIDHRIAVEEKVIGRADMVVASTRHEIDEQYRAYITGDAARFQVLPPGMDIQRFRPFYDDDALVDDAAQRERIKQAQYYMTDELERFLREPHKPLILALARPDRKKNIPALVHAYGSDKDLSMMANLAVFAGIRRDITRMEDNEREVLTELLLLMDKYDLYGKLAIPKRHDFEYEVPELYRLAARTQGVFVNPALTEPFGLTLIEAAASGLPIVATNHGGPCDIVKNCGNGILVDPSSPQEIGESIKRLLTDRGVWKTCSQNGVLGVRNHYTWREHCRNYLNAVSDLPAGPGPDIGRASKPKRTGRRLAGLDRLFISDIDNTLLGDEQALQRLLALLTEHRSSIGFGVASGRTPENALKILQDNGIPTPDVLIGCVGTEICYGPSLRLDRGWQTHLAMQWDRDRVEEVLGGFSELQKQPEDAQRPFKLSYYLEGDNAQQTLHAIHAKLREAGVKHTIVYSSARDLDVLPYRASKGKAVRYLHYKWSVPLDHILISGDSGNDADMLRGEVLGIVVSNHQPELEALRNLRHVYFASRPAAAGILEGFEHYDFMHLH